MYLTEEARAFLQARMHLPHPDHCSKPFYIICIGNRIPYSVASHYWYADHPSYVFYFYKTFSTGTAAHYHWCCTDPELQEIIYQNQFASLRLLTDWNIANE